MKPRIAIHGNCQANALQGMMLNHRPLLDRYEIVIVKPVHEMSMADRSAMANLVGSLDVFVFQNISAQWEPADTDYLLGFLKGQRLELPSMWLSGHTPDMTYFVNDSGVKPEVRGIDWYYHSRLIANCFARGSRADAAVSMFVDPEALDRNFLKSNYRDGVAELKRREASCELTITDLIERKGTAWRGFHTVNHPRGEVLTHVFDQIMVRLGIERLVSPDRPNPLGLVDWPVTASARDTFGVLGTVDALMFGDVVPIADFVAHFYQLYEDQPHLLATNAALFDDRWVNEAVTRATLSFG